MRPNPYSPGTGTNRREFLQTSAAGLAAAGLAGAAEAKPQEKQVNEQGIPLRPLGKSGEMVTLICLGGHHVGRADNEQDDIKLIQKAIDEGITFLDNAWDYHDGGSEERMGKALAEGGRRDKCFLMTKVCARDAKGAQEQLEDSLRRLKTDHIDLWQFHEINYGNDADWIFDDDGAIEVARKAKEQGKVRYIGFTGHKDPLFHKSMLEKDFEWDAVQMPLNVLDGRYRSFQHEILPVLKERGIGVIGMKSLGGGGSVNGGVIIDGTGIDVKKARRYVYSLPISTLVCGIDSLDILEQDLQLIRNFEPMSESERKELEAQYLRVATDGRFELFKSSKQYDGPYHRKQHGFAVDAE